MSSGNFGMMNEAYFVGKAVLLDWVNNFLDIRMDRVEDMATGAVYCHIFDALHPNTIKMSKVDFTVRAEFDFIKNWKLLQHAFQKVGVQKLIPVERLIKARYQDNLEFLQWFYKYAHDAYSGDADNPSGYDAFARRCKAKGGKEFTGNFKNVGGISGPSTSRTGTVRPTHHHSSNQHTTTTTSHKRGKENVSHHRPLSAAPNKHNRGYKSGSDVGSVGGDSQASGPTTTTTTTSTSQYAPNGGGGQNETSARVDVLEQELKDLKMDNGKLREGANSMENKISTLTREHEELQNVAKEIEKERDFYFNKVLEVEKICKNHDNQEMPLLTSIYNILYQTDEMSAEASDHEPAVEDF